VAQHADILEEQIGKPALAPWHGIVGRQQSLPEMLRMRGVFLVLVQFIAFGLSVERIGQDSILIRRRTIQSLPL
jgi:hypothetical protein